MDYHTEQDAQRCVEIARRVLEFRRLKVFKLNYERVMEKLKEYTERAVSRGAVAVILIGSLARGDYTAFSDADVIVVRRVVPQEAPGEDRGLHRPNASNRY